MIGKTFFGYKYYIILILTMTFFWIQDKNNSFKYLDRLYIILYIMISAIFLFNKKPRKHPSHFPIS